MRHSHPNLSGLTSLCRLGAVVTIAGMAWTLPASGQSAPQSAPQSLDPLPSLPAVPPPAESALPRYQYQEGSFTATAQIDPLAGRLLGRLVQKEIPSAITLSATELAGSFAIPEGAATQGNGVITLDSTPVKTFLEPYLQAALAQVAQTYNLPDDMGPDNIGIETLEAILNYRFSGQGQLQATAPLAGAAPFTGTDGSSTRFTFEYSDRADRLTITGIDPAVLALCQVQRCHSQLDGDFDLKIDIQGFSEASDQLGIELPSSVRQSLNQARLFGIREVSFADGQLTSAVQVQPEQTLAQPDPDATAPQLGRSSQPQFATPMPLLSGHRPAPSRVTPRLTQGNFILTAERLTAPWSAVFSVSSP